MKHIWHDGGRAAGGGVNQTGDCVVRSISIALGANYRDTYNALAALEKDSPRDGISDRVIRHYLRERGWQYIPLLFFETEEDLPGGTVLVHFRPSFRKRTGHLSCVVDHTVYDTWNPFDDDDFLIDGYWAYDDSASDTTLPVRVPGNCRARQEGPLTHEQYEKILRRVKALHRTASNAASTEGEIHNALRAMQALMLQHNLSRSDLVEEGDARGVGMTCMACPLNGSKAYQWETNLAFYIVDEIFPTVQFYRARRGHRTLFWFYGPVDDVEQAIGLFRELLVTIATAAQVKFGNHTRGSGASYAEGYVNGLPRSHRKRSGDPEYGKDDALIHTRTLAIQTAARKWLYDECGVRLVALSSSSRYDFDPHAHQVGQHDGATHDVSAHRKQKRISHHPGP